MYYYLKGHTPIPCSTMEEWCEKTERYGHTARVAETLVGTRRVSTVFIPATFGPEDPPLLFETMVFGGDLDGFQNRTATWEAALAEHNRLVAIVRAEREGELIEYASRPRAMSESFVVGNTLKAVCASCNKVVRVDKPIFGSLHLCVS